MTFVFGMITGALVLAVCCCAVLSGNLSREEEQRTVDDRTDQREKEDE